MNNKSLSITTVSTSIAQTLCHDRFLPSNATIIVEQFEHCLEPRHWAKMVNGQLYDVFDNKLNQDKFFIVAYIDHSVVNMANSLVNTHFSVTHLTRNQREVLQDKLEIIGIERQGGYSGIEEENAIHGTINNTCVIKPYNSNTVNYFSRSDFTKINIDDFFNPNDLNPVKKQTKNNPFSTKLKHIALNHILDNPKLLKRIAPEQSINDKQPNELLYDTLTGDIYLCSLQYGIHFYKWTVKNNNIGFHEVKWQKGQLDHLELLPLTIKGQIITLPLLQQYLTIKSF